jgi:hypothetical protein
MKKRTVFIAIPLLILVMVLAGCPGKATGTLEFYANGEDFVRQGFVSKDGWSIQFDHVYITLDGIAAYQTDPPYAPPLAPMKPSVSTGPILWTWPRAALTPTHCW